MKKMKGLLLGSTALLCGMMAIGVCQNTNDFKKARLVSADTSLELPEDTFEEKTTDWYTIDAYAYSADEDGKYSARADLDLLFSPVFSDYASVNKDTIKGLVSTEDGLIAAAKYILSTQIKFIEPVEMDKERPTEDIGSTYDAQRDAIFEQFVKAALINDIDDETFVEEFDKFLSAMTGEVNENLIKSNGNFLRAILAYLASQVPGAQTSQEAIEAIASRLGIDGDNVDVNSGLGLALGLIYDRNDNEGNHNQEIRNDILKIYGDACAIAEGTKSSSVALGEVFILLQETKVPMDTMVAIFGQETIKNAVIDIFQNPKISVEVARYMLSAFTTDTCYQLCDNVEFTKDEILEAVEQIEPARLMEITRGLDKKALDNIRIILGMANDEGSGETKSHIRRDQSHYSWKGQYNEFGNNLVTAVLNNMSLFDLINAIEAVWLGDADDNYLVYSYNYSPDGGNSTGRCLYLHNLVDWFKKYVPTLEEINSLDDGALLQKKFHIEFTTPLNDQTLFVDLNIGFQNKDTTMLRRLIEVLDNGIDFEFDFLDASETSYGENTFTYNLDIHPDFLHNLYVFLCNSGAIFNSEDNRLLESLFDLMYGKTFGEIKEYFNQNLAENIKRDLKNIDYEIILNTLLVFDNYKEVFKGTKISQNEINQFVQNLKILFDRLSLIDYDTIYNALVSFFGKSIADKFNNETLKSILSDLHALTTETDLENISIDVLKALTNSDVYGFVDLLNGKESTLNRIGKLLYRLVSIIPDEFDNKKLMDFYKDGDLVFDLLSDSDYQFLINWDDIFNLLPLGDKIYNVLHTMVVPEDHLVCESGMITINLNEGLDSSSNELHQVTFNFGVGEEEKTLTGLLPEGAKLLDFAPNVIGESEVNYWYDESSNQKVDVMPNTDITLVPVYKFDITTVSTNTTFVYDGSSKANITINNSDTQSDYTYTWQYFDEETNTWVDMEGVSGTSLDIQYANDEGKYRCIVENNFGDQVISDVVVISIQSEAVLDFSTATWSYSGPFAYDGDYHTVKLENTPGQEGVDYIIHYHNNSEYESGTYVASAEIEILSHQYKLIAPSTCTWTILDPVYYHTFFSIDTDSDKHSLGIVTLDTGILEDANLNVINDPEAFEGDEINKEQLSSLDGEITSAYTFKLTYEYNGTTIELPIKEMSGTVSLLLPANLKETDNFEIITVDLNGNIKTVEFEISEDGLYAIFHVDNICQVGILETQNIQFDWTILILIIFMLINIVILCAWIRRSSHFAYLKKLSEEIEEKHMDDDIEVDVNELNESNNKNSKK